MDTLAIDVGLGLVKLVEGGADSPLLRRVRRDSPAVGDGPGLHSAAGASAATTSR